MTGLIVFVALLAAALIAVRVVRDRMQAWDAAERARAPFMYVPPKARQRGIVKEYDPEKGWGFIAPTAGGEQVLLPGWALQKAGLEKVLPGQHIEYALVTEDGNKYAEDLTFPPAPKESCGCSK